MPLISLETGLVVRRGARTLEFMRLLPGNKVQFQDQLTQQVQTFHLARFYAGVLAKQFVPVLAEEEETNGPSTRPKFVKDFSCLKEKEQASLRRKLKYVAAMRRRGISRGQRSQVAKSLPEIAEKIKDVNPPSVSTVLDWMRKYEVSARNPASLISGNSHRRRSSRVNELVEAVINRKLKAIYLTRSRQTLKHTLDHIRRELNQEQEAGKLSEADARVSMSTVQRRLKELNPFEVVKARYGAQYARAKFRTSVEGTLATRPLQRIECDHTLLNWVVICDRTGLPLGRPTLTIVVDSFSGYVVGIYVSFYGPGLTSVLNVLKNAILPKDDLAKAAGTKKPWIAFGIGETLLLDNGMEFHSAQFQLAAWELGIDLEYCRVRTPWLKPKVERFFLNLDFLAGRGRVFKPVENAQRIDPVKDAAITFTDFLRGLIQFVVDVYPFESNSRTLEMPFEKYQSGLLDMPPPLFPSSFDQLDMIAAMSKQLTVASGGVELLGLPYSSPELMVMKKAVASRFRTLVKWSPDDLEQVYVQNPRDQTWLIVPSLWPQYTSGLSWIQHRLVRQHAREKRIEGGMEKVLSQARLDIHDIWMEPIARVHRRKDATKLAQFSGASSSTLFRAEGAAKPVPTPEQVISREEVSASHDEVEIPDFESFQLA